MARAAAIAEPLPVSDREALRLAVRTRDHVLHRALMRAASEVLRTVIFDNMATRCVELLKEDMACMGPIRLRDAHDAQGRIMTEVRDLLVRGEITGWKTSRGRE